MAGGEGAIARANSPPNFLTRLLTHFLTYFLRPPRQAAAGGDPNPIPNQVVVIFIVTPSLAFNSLTLFLMVSGWMAGKAESQVGG